MKTLVVYDSFFGNTEKIAQAIGGALGDAQVVRVGAVQPAHLAGLQCLVVGSPTRAFQPSPATKQWLNSLPAGSLNGVKVTAFDTRMDVKAANNAILTFMAGIFGYAAQPMAKKLAGKGGTLAAAPEGFIVKASEGPLKEGELERAVAWAKQMAGAR